MALSLKRTFWHFGRKGAWSCHCHKPVAHLHTHMILFMRVIEVNVMLSGGIDLSQPAQVTDLVLLQPAQKLPKMATTLPVIFWAKRNLYTNSLPIITVILKKTLFKITEQFSEFRLQFI